MNTFYAYIHARPDGTPFYIGKGNGKRCYRMSGRSSYHQRVINKHGAKNILVGKMECSSEEIAFDLERGLIKCFRRMGIELTNRTDGGDGVSGLEHTDETKQKLSALFDNPKYVEKHSNAVKEAHVRSKELYSASAKESQNRPEVLAKHKAYQGSLEVKAAKSEWGSAAWKKPSAIAWREKINSANKSENARKAKSESMLGKNSGKVYVFKDAVVKSIPLADLLTFIAQGWAKGNPHVQGRATNKGTIWATDGKVNKMIPATDFVKFETDGWKRGRK